MPDGPEEGCNAAFYRRVGELERLVGHFKRRLWPTAGRRVLARSSAIEELAAP